MTAFIGFSTNAYRLRLKYVGYQTESLRRWYAEGGSEPDLKQGVNEKNLTVITARASSIPRNMRGNRPGKHGVIKTLLSGHANCDEVLAEQDAIFPSTRATLVMMSDRRRIVMNEEGLEGKYAIKTVPHAGTNSNGPAFMS